MPSLPIPKPQQIIPYEIQTLVASYAGCVFFHYMAANLYPWLCTPVTWTGLILSPFYVPMPQCRALAWMIYTGNDAIGHMWLGLGGWLVMMIGRRICMCK
jgi:hypothetical protein